MNTRLLLVLMALLLATATLITAQSSSSSTGGTGQECGWQVGQGFTECSVTCGNGTYERELICVDATTFEQQNDTTCCGPYNGQVEEFPCNLGECDDTASSSSSTGGTDTSSSTGSSSTGGTGQECEWQVGQGFTECSETCGTGVFTRELICFDQEANEETEDTSCCGTYDGGALDYWACNLGPCSGDDDGSEPSNDTQTEGCEWQIGRGFTPCSVSCGPGVYSRELVCYDHDNDTYVNDTSCCGEYSGGPLYYWTCNLGNCDTNTSEPEEPQGNNETCTWWEDGYTECSVSCGYGVFTRTWICVLDGEAQNDTACCGENDNEVEYWSCFSGECQPDNGTGSEPGNSTDNSTCTWQYDGFTECSTSCGPGIFTNALVCVLDNTTLSDVTCCGDYTGPVEYWACNLGACDDESPSVPQGEGCEWQVGQGFTECSETCGDGTYTRELICYNYDTDSVETDTTCCGEFEGRVDEWACNLGDCDDGSVPQSEPSCPSDDDDDECEQYQWVWTEFGNCSASCNTSVASRKVLCIAPDWTIASDDECTDERPEEEEECQLRPCEDDEEPEPIETPELDYEWATSNWTECSVTCGIGHQTRRTLCISANNTAALNEDCDDADRPECDATCQLAPCEEEPPTNGTQSYHNKFTRLRKLFKRN